MKRQILNIILVLAIFLNYNIALADSIFTDGYELSEEAVQTELFEYYFDEDNFDDSPAVTEISNVEEEYGILKSTEIIIDDKFSAGDNTEETSGVIDDYSVNSTFLDEDLYAYNSSNVPAYLFDATYYSAKYSDLRAAFGTNKTQLYNHWCNYGKREGRSPSPVYNPTYYLNNNADLKAAFGTNYSALYDHFSSYGINEFRASSEIYNGSFYKNTYADLRNAFGNSSKSYILHFMNYGMNEGRQANGSFNVSIYKQNYTDLQRAFGNTLKSYYYHYMENGISEGRNATSVINTNTNNNNNSGNNSNNTSNSKTGWVKTSGSNLNLRNKASSSILSKVICKIPNGSKITVYGNKTNNFYKVSYGGYTGYASANYITFTQPNSTNTNTTNVNTKGLISTNLSKVSLIKQGSKTCKATAVAQSLNIILGRNAYTTGMMGNSSCKSIQGNVYTGSDGNRYVATYKTDNYVGSRSEQQAQINKAISAGLPIIVTVHKTTSGTKHHWVTIIGKNGNTYDIIDPATGTKRTMTSAKYDFGLADYSNGKHYGYISFTRK